MTKNVVQRLQTIQQDLNSVISIYDITSKPENNDASCSKNNRGVQEVIETDAPNCSESTTNPFGNPSYTLLGAIKETGSFVTRPFKGTNSDESLLVINEERQNLNQQKPGSAPSEISNQSYEIRRPTTEATSDIPETQSLLSVNTYENVCQTVWYDCKSSTDGDSNTASSDNLINTLCAVNKDEDVQIPVHEPASKFIANRRQCLKNLGKRQSDSVKTTAHDDCESQVGRSHPFFPRSVKPSDSSNLPVSISPVTPKTPVRKDRPWDHNTKVPTRVPRVATPRTPSPDSKKTRQPSNVGNYKAKKDEEGVNDNNKCSPTSKTPERASSRARQEEKSFGDRFQKEKKPRGVCYNQKLGTHAGEDKEVVVNESSVAISQSNEKLEKIKLSKDMALNLAKQLKEKYEDLRNSKEEQLEKIEKENNRLSIEIKAAELSKKELQQKIEEIRNESQTKLRDRELKIQRMEAENSSLKIKLCEMEKEYTEKIQQMDKEIDRVQSERLLEVRNVYMVRQSCAGDIERLTNENSDLRVKVGELQDLLNENHLKRENLEEQNRRLQKSQNQGFKKRETQEETNHELESIRQNSKDLEEQVKTLRKSIEAFDEVQQKLIKQTTEYQHQMQTGLEEIETLKTENTKLKRDLENEKDALLIKIKIIEDQQETIKQLKEKSEEVKNLLKKNQSLERILNIEREEKLELEDAVEHLNRRKEELKKKIKHLESDLLLAPQEVVRDLQKTQSVLHELENQVQAKQKEWEFHLQCLIRQKEQACNVAEIATKKLMRITGEFQKQSEAYKALQRVLAENMAVKDNNKCEMFCARNT